MDVIFNGPVTESAFTRDTKDILRDPDVFASVGATPDPESFTAYGK